MDFTAIFLHFFNVSISASFLALALVLFRFIFKKAPKWLVVSLWVLVAIRLIVPFSLESALSLIPSKEVIPTEIMSVDPTKTHDTAFGLIDNPTYSDIFNSTVVVDDVDSFQLDVIFASYGWIIGLAVLLLYALVSYLRLRYTVRVSMPYKDNVWLCDSVKSPFILGIFRPRIYLPSDMSEETRNPVLAHEKAHLKRKDHLWKPLGFVLLCVYWFNPVMWLSYVLLCRDIELACDERVIRDMEAGDKKAYSEALLSCSVPQKIISACPVAFGEVGVKKRIKSVLSYKKPAFWIILIAVVVSIVLAVCFMTDPKEKSGESIAGVDQISELSFPMKEIVRGAHTYTIYDGISTTDNYFDAKIEDMSAHSEVYHFLDFLTLDELPDGEVNPMHEPQTNGVIKIQTNAHAPVSVIFHDNFSKMYMQKTTDFYSVRSKDYAVFDTQGARQFFEEKPYMNHLVWEYNLTSSAWGHGEINVFVDEKYEISGEITGDGVVERITDEEKGLDGISWRPDVEEKLKEYVIEIPVTREGESSVFTFIMTMVGKRGLASYYSLRADDLVIATFPSGYEFVLSEAETGEYDDTSVYLGNLNSEEFGVELFTKLMMTDGAVIRNGSKEAIVYECSRILLALDEWRFEKGYYSHPSEEALEDMKKYSIEVDDDMGENYSVNFDNSCNIMWLKGDGWSDFPHRVINPKAIRSFFENQEFFDDSFVWEYNALADNNGQEVMQLIVEGEYESYTAECSQGSLMTTTVSDDRTGDIVHSEPVKKITCTKEDNLVWRPADSSIRTTEIIYVEQKLANGEAKDFYIYVNDVGTNYSGNILYEVSAESATLMMKKSGSKVSCYFDQTYDVNWLYSPMNSATWYYVTKFVLPEGYEIKSAVATSGTATVEDLYYNDPLKEKCVQWTPDKASDEGAVLTVFALKDGKEINFTVDIELLDANPETSGRRTYRISPKGCKLREQALATYLLEEK